MMMSGDLDGARARTRELLAAGASGFELVVLTLARDVSIGTEREGYERQLREKNPARAEILSALTPAYSLIFFEPVRSAEAGNPGLAGSPGSVPAAPAVPKPTPAEQAVSVPLFYQLGAFRDEANAASLSSRLSRAGFKPQTVRRESRTGILSIVYLDAGPDPARLMIALKDAGFESWPLFASP
jgi:hypothetical protein